MRASHGLWLVAAAFAVAACSSCSSSSSGNGASSSSSSGGGSGGSSGGGSGSSSGGVDAGPSATQACDDWATAICSQLSKCSPFAFQTTYADMTTCQTRVAIPCPTALAANGTKTTPSDLEQCVAAINAETCDESLDNQQPSACSIPGTVAAGAACGSDWQCSTGFCALTAGLCGTCATRAMPGQKGPDGGAVCIVDAQCAATSICVGGNCVTPGMMGATCSNTAPCLHTLACIGGTCKTPLAVGATCAAATDCDGSKGLYCDSKSKTCTQTGTAATGGMCGIVNGVLVACSGANACANVSMQGEGTCHQAAADGAPCGTGVTCQAPAVCIKSTSYSCELPNAGNCH